MGGVWLARTGILADIHGNEEALTTVLAQLDDLGVQDVICLGDTVDYGPRPLECLALLTARGIPAIQGNHDAAVVGAMTWERFSQRNYESLAWTDKHLNGSQRQYVQQLPERLELGWATAIHGSPHEALWHYVKDAQAALLVFRLATERLFLVGHTHMPGAFCYTERRQVKVTPGRTKIRHFSEPGARELSLDADLRYVINPGSVGQPRDNDPRASFAVVDHEAGTARQVTWYRVPYDWHKTRQQILAAGLPSLYGDRLLVGQ